MKVEIIKPADIEKKSFSIITEELGDRTFPAGQDLVVKRVIHTTADFEYADSLAFSENVVELAKDAMRNGAHIVTDTKMAFSGINKAMVERMGGVVHCFMSDEEVASEAKARGITRAAVSMEKACTLDAPLIFAIGNAPTALIRLTELIDEGKILPKLIIGVPVGFVNVIESKTLIMTKNVPYIVARGRKGGSNVAAAICNALLYQINQRDGF